MSRLLIEQVKYIGSDYIYESPILKAGINILEGENGSGKTTFSSLIYFGLGGNVKWFRKGNNVDHKQIVDDNTNYVELTFYINDVKYLATRYFYNNEIHIVSEKDVISLPINRGSNNKVIFSDWILKKLDIQVVDIYQGSEDYKINFLDLFRLFYHDQNTQTDKIYKKPDNENFITDSIIIRKAIFEILTGNSFDEYYKAISDYRKILEEQTTIKALMQNFESLNVDSSEIFEGKNSFNLDVEIKELLSQLNKLEEYRETINDNVTSIKSSTEILTNKRNSFSDYEEKLILLKKERGSVVNDYSRVKRLRENIVLEVTQLKKIITTNEKLNLFSPNTCPYCLKKSQKEENKCICGNDVTDEQYQKFFYTKEEYFNILKSKQKNIETIDKALDSFLNEIKLKNDKIALLDNKLSELKTDISDLVKGRKIIKNLELKQVNEKIFEIEKNIGNLRQQIKVEKKREELEQQKNSLSLRVDSSKREMEKKKLAASESMDEVIISFNKKYYSLMEKALDDCRSARISNDDYMPIINSGTYKEASSNVSKRLMYFFTLLHLSLTMKTKFPKFLLIDTPENIGIDNDNLIKIISLINELGDENFNVNDGQIILTTGQGKYPEHMDSFVFERITKKKKLLTKRVFDIGL